MSKHTYTRLTDKEVRMFRARGRDRETEVDHDWHRERYLRDKTWISKLQKDIADLNERISKQNVELLLAKASKELP